MGRIGRVAVVCALAAALVLPASTAAVADLNDFEFESFHADFVLSRDAEGHAHLEVTERIVAIFPEFDQNRGFYRDIPEYRHGVRLHTRVDSVVDEHDRPVPFETEYYQDFYSVALGDDSFVHGRQTYVIRYSQIDVVEGFADTGVDEFYWDVNGTGWAQPFGEVSMTLTVDPELAPTLTGAAECYDLAGRCPADFVGVPADDGSVRFEASTTDVAPGESLTVAVAFEPGTFEPGPQVIPPPTEPPAPVEPQRPGWEAAAPVVLLPAAIGIAAIARVTQGSGRVRRTRASDIIVPRYEPPEGVNPMLAAYIAGEPDRAVTAQIVDFAVRGKVRLLEHPDGGDDFVAEYVDRSGLDDLERRLFDSMFGSTAQPGARLALTRVRLGKRVSSIHRAIESDLRRYDYRAPSRPRALWAVLCVLAVAVALVAVAAVLTVFDRGRSAGAGLVFITLFVAGWGVLSTFSATSTIAPLSSKGRKVNDQLLGIKDYLELAEKDRIRMLQSPQGAERIPVDDDTQLLKLYERLLPYAIIWGVEDRWIKEIVARAEAARMPVRWFTPDGDLTAWRLQSTIHGVRRAAPSAPKPAVARAVGTRGGGGGWSSGGSGSGWSFSSGSSFSGGSSGGGFSGGGGGGGGGRGR